MKNFDEMVEYYRNHPEEAKNILKHAGKLEEDKRQKNPDEIVLEDVKLFHLENMNESAYWCGIQLNDGRYFHLNIHGDNLRLYWSDETPE
jgi:hypothetical protein